MFDGGNGVLGDIDSITPPPNMTSWVDAKSLILVLSDSNTFTQFSSESLENFRWACTCAFLSRGPCGRCRISVLEWMNEWCIYIALFVYCCTPKALYNHVGGSLLNHHQCAASTWMMRWMPQDNGASALTTHQLQMERRERGRANQVDGDY